MTDAPFLVDVSCKSRWLTLLAGLELAGFGKGRELHHHDVLDLGHEGHARGRVVEVSSHITAALAAYMDTMCLIALDAEVLEVTLMLSAAACATHTLKTPGRTTLAAIQGTDVCLVGGSGANVGKRGGLSLIHI